MPICTIKGRRTPIVNPTYFEASLSGITDQISRKLVSQYHTLASVVAPERCIWAMTGERFPRRHKSPNQNKLGSVEVLRATLKRQEKGVILLLHRDVPGTMSYNVI